MRLFHLDRRQDLTGVSGTGVIAEGVEFSDGTVVLHWINPPRSTGVYPDIDAVVAVHDHEDMTKVVWK